MCPAQVLRSERTRRYYNSDSGFPDSGSSLKADITRPTVCASMLAAAFNASANPESNSNPETGTAGSPGSCTVGANMAGAVVSPLESPGVLAKEDRRDCLKVTMCPALRKVAPSWVTSTTYSPASSSSACGMTRTAAVSLCIGIGIPLWNHWKVASSSPRPSSTWAARIRVMPMTGGHASTTVTTGSAVWLGAGLAACPGLIAGEAEEAGPILLSPDMAKAVELGLVTGGRRTGRVAGLGVNPEAIEKLPRGGAAGMLELAEGDGAAGALGIALGAARPGRTLMLEPLDTVDAGMLKDVLALGLACLDGVATGTVVAGRALLPSWQDGVEAGLAVAVRAGGFAWLDGAEAAVRAGMLTRRLGAWNRVAADGRFEVFGVKPWGMEK